MIISKHMNHGRATVVTKSTKEIRVSRVKRYGRTRTREAGLQMSKDLRLMCVRTFPLLIDVRYDEEVKVNFFQIGQLETGE